LTDHERIEELLALRALGGLESQDEAALGREMATHGADCAECRRLVTELEETAGRLAFALDPVPVPTGMEDRLVASVKRGATVVPFTRLDERAGRDRRGGAWRAAVGIAAAFVLFAGGWVVRDLAEPSSDGAAVALEGAEVVTFEGASGSLAVAYRPGVAGVYVFGSDLPAPPAGKVYEVWMIQEDTPVPGPCLTPRADGSLFTYVDVELGTTETMAVTVESSSCPSAPTSEPILTADLTSA
jgi:hypothetical protein